jgi:hypothetical protein
VFDPELHPAERELRQPQKPRARKRCAVVGSDPCWDPVLSHGCFAGRSNLAEVHTRDDLATNQKATMRVSDRERITALAVAGGEVAFEIHAPQLIRTRHQRERL